MKLSLRHVLFWTPRVLGVLFISFLSMFALDVFGAGYGFWGTALALLMHLMPSLVLLAALGLSWRWPWVGGLAFIGFAVWYLVPFEMASLLFVYPLLVGVPFLIGLLFMLDWWCRSGVHTPRRAMQPR